MQKMHPLLWLSVLVAGSLLTHDPSLASSPQSASGELIVCPRPLPTARDYESLAARNVVLEPRAEALVAPLEDTFRLHSNPGATQILFIDWDGHKKGGYKAWDVDGDPGSFSDAERSVIQQTWLSVSEDFLPFNIDVTTEEPPSGWLGQRAVVDGSGRYDYSWAYGGAWADPRGDIAYVYPGDDTWLWIADSITHEVGHTLNLGHDGRGAQEYYTGHGSGETEWCPVMGWGAYSLNTWSNGDYHGATNQQDDLAVITAVAGVDYRADDHGGDIFSATPMTLSAASLELSAEGIISKNDDVDYFAFTLSTDSDVALSINEDAVIGAANLDVLARIHDARGAVIHTADPLDSISASFQTHLPAGDYYLSIDGVGWGSPLANPPVGYSDYAILGYYSVRAMANGSGPDVTPPSPNPASFASPPAADGDSAMRMVATPGTDASGPIEYFFSETSGNPGGSDSGWQVSTSYSDDGLAPATQYSYTVAMRDALGNVGTASSPASASTPGGPCIATSMHVDSITAAASNVGRGAKIGRASVTVVDDCGDTVASVTVTGTFTGDYQETQAASTNGSGVSLVETAGTAKGNVSFSFCVDDVSGSNLPYASEDSAETCDRH
jgi:hypothetical protein